MTSPPEERSPENLPVEPETVYEPEDVNRAASLSPAESSQMPEADTAQHDPLAPLRIRDYQLYTFGGLIASLGAQMFSVAVGWELYARTRNPWTLGLVALIQAIPVIFLALPAGDVADRFDRRRIALIAEFIVVFCWFAFALISRANSPLSFYYTLILVEATTQAFHNPARTALLPQLVPEELLARAITWNSSRWQIASMAGPAVGGFAVALFGAAPVYAIAASCALISFLLTLPLRPHPLERPHESEDALHRLLAGIRFIRGQDLFLATITLDLVAVFLGGAVTLLPVFAYELNIGAVGLGWLRAAPAAGALVMSLCLSLRPPMKRAGKSLLWAVAGFGAATIGFGLSRSFWLSMVMLALTGALDNVSVTIRHTLLTILTPPHMRGRVSAVNSVFIGSSNELGGFESGLAARILGATSAVVFGGIGTILSVLACDRVWPRLRELRELDELRPLQVEATEH